MTTNGTDPNLVPGWNVQSNVGAQQGYAQPGNTTASVTNNANGNPGQPYGGVSNPPSNSSPAFEGGVDAILANVGYGDSTGPVRGTTLTAPTIPAASGGIVQSPSASLVASVAITGGAGISVQIATTNYTNTVWQTVFPVNGLYTVPPGGYLKLTYTTIPTSWTWTA